MSGILRTFQIDYPTRFRRSRNKTTALEAPPVLEKMDGLKNIEVPAEHHLSRMQRGIPVERKPAQCPVCGSKSVKPILYGMPSPDCDFSKYIIGGCCIWDDSPDWGCESCGADFIRKDAGKTK